MFQDENHIYNQQSIKQLNLQLQHLKIYQDILNEAQSQYELIIQTINNLSTEFKDLQLQQFKQYVSKIEKDFSIMKKLTHFDKVEAELKQSKEDKQFLQNQLTESEKTNLSNQQIIIEEKQINEEQIQIIQDLRNEKEVLRVKVKEVEQQKSQFEDNLKEKQEQLERFQQSNQKNEEIVKQLQQFLSQQFCQYLTFSSTYKHNKCQVTQNGKVIENNSNVIK